MPIPKATLETMKKVHFHTIILDDKEGKMCAKEILIDRSWFEGAKDDPNPELERGI